MLTLAGLLEIQDCITSLSQPHFGVPILIGSNFDKFPEAKKLQQLAGLFSVKSEKECTQILKKLINDKSFRSKTGMIAGHFINSNTGATKKIMSYIEKLNRDGVV